MSTTPKMDSPRAIWMRYTSNDGARHVMEHIVWNKDLFIERRTDDARVEARKKPGGKASAEQITEEQYKAER